MKLNVSLAAISTAAVMSGVLLSVMSPTQASACPFSKYKGTTAATGDSPNSSFISKPFDFNKMGIAGAGIAGVAGIFAAGMVYKARRSRLTDAAVAQVSIEPSEFSSDTVEEVVLYAPNPEETVSTSTPDRDLTLVS